jgi:BON domain
MRRLKPFLTASIVAAAVLLFADCNAVKNLMQKPVDDKTLVTEVQAKLFADPVLKVRDIRVSAQNGVVTLAGTVNTELEKAASGRFASQVEGVKSVQNELTVGETTAAATAPPAAATPSEAPPAPAVEPKSTKKRGHFRPFGSNNSNRDSARNSSMESSPAPDEMSSNESKAPATPADQTAAPVVAAQAAAPAQPDLPPPPPPPITTTLAAGTVITVRMIDGIDSARNHAGEEFAATVASPVVQDGKVVVPAGSDARVRLVEAKSAGHMSGQSELVAELTGLAVYDSTYNVETSVNQTKGASRGTRTAETIGGASAIGAMIGAIASHGKGAAIGAGIGAAGGTAVQAGTKGEQVKIAPETKLDFTLKSPLTITLPQ